VLVNGEQSDASQVTSGVTQGIVLALLLFQCFINDLPTNIYVTGPAKTGHVGTNYTLSL